MSAPNHGADSTGTRGLCTPCFEEQRAWLRYRDPRPPMDSRNPRARGEDAAELVRWQLERIVRSCANNHAERVTCPCGFEGTEAAATGHRTSGVHL